MKPTKILAALTLCAVTALAIAAAGGRLGARSEAATPRNAQARSVVPAPQQQQSEYLHPGGLWPQLRGALRAMGDRLERPGKERLTLTGVLTRDGVSTPFVMVSEFPGKLRLETGERGNGHAVVFNERASGQGAATERDADLVETLAFDTAEHFFEGQSRGVGTRLLGTHFREDDGTTVNYAGPFYDIYQVEESVGAGRGARRRSKLFYVNSDTLLVERVRYEDDRGGSTIHINVELEWQQVGGQRVPKRVTRTEDGSPVITLVVNAAVVAQRTEDGLFAAAQ